MEERKKRKAKDQLSPYSNPVEEEEVFGSTVDAQVPVERKKAKARVGGSSAITNSESLKGVLSSVNILKPTVKNDAISGLNRCFLKALQTVIETESNKSLFFLFRQYEKYYEELTNTGD